MLEAQSRSSQLGVVADPPGSASRPMRDPHLVRLELTVFRLTTAVNRSMLPQYIVYGRKNSLDRSCESGESFEKAPVEICPEISPSTFLHKRTCFHRCRESFLSAHFVSHTYQLQKSDRTDQLLARIVCCIAAVHQDCLQGAQFPSSQRLP